MRYVVELAGITPVRKEALKHDVMHMAWTVTDEFLGMVYEIDKHVPIRDAVPNLEAYENARASILRVTFEDDEDRMVVTIDTQPLEDAIKAIKASHSGGLLERLRGKVTDTMLAAIQNKLDDELREYAQDLEQYADYVQLYKEG